MLLQQYPQTVPSRREFLGSWLGLFLPGQNRRKLAGIEFRVLRHQHSARRFLLIHGNEETARKVLTEHMKGAPGIAYLVQNHTRNVSIDGGDLDPNRMFSREGAERNLRALNPRWTDAQIRLALDELDRTRHQVLDAVRPHQGDVLIAVHNNRDYSVKDELANSNRTALNDGENPREFCLCTNENDFECLAKGPYNVVLQNQPGGQDDGSLSRYAVRAGYRYANLEVALGKYEKQKAMLEWLDKTLPRA